MVTIPRVRPHKYLNLSKAEGLIFMFFAMLNDSVNMVMKKKKGDKSEFSQNFLQDKYSKLSNIGIEIENIKDYAECLRYLVNECNKHIKRKDMLPHGIQEIGALCYKMTDIRENPSRDMEGSSI